MGLILFDFKKIERSLLNLNKYEIKELLKLKLKLSINKQRFDIYKIEENKIKY